VVGGKFVSKTSLKSILDDVDKTLNRLLLKYNAICPVYEKPRPQYKHLKYFQRLKLANVPNHFGRDLVVSIYEQINSNWTSRDPENLKIRSSENFRFVPQINLRKQVVNSARSYTEVSLERRIVEVAEKRWPGTWVNQVPTGSGLANGVRDTHRNIDLVCRREDGSVELIELKVVTESGHPLYAALEILQYGVLYMFYRINNLKQLEPPNSIPKFLDVPEIHLKVLAPLSYYGQLKSVETKLVSLESVITSGLSRFLAEHQVELDRLKMDFQFESFPPGFMQDQNTIPESPEIGVALLDRKAVCPKHA
jgi:hypothetical protein